MTLEILVNGVSEQCAEFEATDISGQIAWEQCKYTEYEELGVPCATRAIFVDQELAMYVAVLMGEALEGV